MSRTESNQRQGETYEYEEDKSERHKDKVSQINVRQTRIQSEHSPARLICTAARNSQHDQSAHRFSYVTNQTCNSVENSDCNCMYLQSKEAKISNCTPLLTAITCDCSQNSVMTAK